MVLSIYSILMTTTPLNFELDILRQITEHSLDAFFLYNLKTARFEYVNAAFEEISGQSVQGINEAFSGLLSSVHAEDLPILQKGYERLLATAFRQSAEVRIRAAADQSEKWLSLTAYIITQGSERHLIAGFVSDITHHKENEITANKFCVHKNAVLEMLAHDLGGPLGAMKGLAAHLLEQSRKKGLKEIEEPASLIYRTADQSIHLIHELLQQEFLESSESAVKKQRVELIEQIQSLLSGFRRMDTEKNKHFELETDADSVWVKIDQTKFMQVLANLVSNAVKFTPENGHIVVRVTQQAQEVRISVEDDGIGIPANMQPFVFDRFTKARRRGLRGEEPVGLGLSIVKYIVELHQGRIWLESVEQQGSRFFIEIPTGE
jgi:two-component system sensor histidine kinase VicK